MQYMLLIYDDPAAGPQDGTPEAEAEMAQWFTYDASLREDGSFVSGEALHPVDQATTVRVRDGQDVVTDGPFAETKEQLLGFYIVDCASLEEVLEIARELGRANPGGAYEIRPVALFSPGSEAA
jgi:hypothetical protein